MSLQSVFPKFRFKNIVVILRRCQHQCLTHSKCKTINFSPRGSPAQRYFPDRPFHLQLTNSTSSIQTWTRKTTRLSSRAIGTRINLGNQNKTSTYHVPRVQTSARAMTWRELILPARTVKLGYATRRQPSRKTSSTCRCATRTTTTALAKALAGALSSIGSLKSE